MTSNEPTTSAFEGCVVAVGASAGGLDALERLFAAMPGDSGAAFVVVQHLSPDHKSMMDTLLGRYTLMPVVMAAQGMQLAANTLFLIPAGTTLRLVGHRLQLAPKPEYGLSLPIDIFFTSAAEQLHQRVVGIVLSGTGSDGSRGLVAINAHGGFVFAQEPTTAKFDGMPRNAIATGLVDVVAPAEQLAERLITHLRNPRATATPPADVHANQEMAQESPFLRILDLLLSSFSIDFRDYKPATVLRRIERRMQVLHLASLTDYANFLKDSPDEPALLRRELLIPVTRFFRDEEVFEQLATSVLPALLQNDAQSREPVRVWVACCATGEEAYSIAMVCAEVAAQLGSTRAIKIFATDVEQEYLDRASAGHYPHNIGTEVSAQRLARWFHTSEGGYKVRPEIRQMVIFAQHNLIVDPPFTRMDLVSCRNALIYFQPAAQDQALHRLQYALVQGGHLLLGPSESLGTLHTDFTPVPGGGKLFTLRRHDRRAPHLEAPGRSSRALRRLNLRPQRSVTALAESAVMAGQKQLAQSYAPPALLVSKARELLHVYGDMSGMLQIAPGGASLDVLKLLPRELSWAAGLILQSAVQLGRPQRSPPLRYLHAGEPAVVQLVARPIDLVEEDESGSQVLLCFERQTDAVATADGAEGADVIAPSLEHQRQVDALERELSLTHDTLQATIEELETSNEELQATNEELMASNEELQSTNEELHSVNEELYTVNSEYQEKVDILNSLNADLEYISRSTAMPTLFVDDKMILTRFTPSAMTIFKLRDGDIGRSLEDFAHHLDYPELFTDIRRTLATGIANEREARSRDGDWWLCRLQAHKGSGWPGYDPNSPRAALTFVNITSVKDAQRLQAVIDSLSERVAVLDPQGTITLVNQAWRRFARDNGDPDLASSGPGVNYLKVCAEAAMHDPAAGDVFEGLSAVLKGQQPRFTQEYPCHTPEAKGWYLMHAAPVAHPGGGAVVSHIEITPWFSGEAVSRKEAA